MGRPGSGEGRHEQTRAANLKELRELIANVERAENAGMRAQLEAELSDAKECVQLEERRVHLRVLQLDSRVISTLRKIRTPIPIVHDVVVAFLLLLGEFEGYTRVCILEMRTGRIGQRY